MIMCDEFLEATFEESERKDPALEQRLAEHGAGCKECAELARDLRAIREVALTIPKEVDPPPWMSDRILEIARKALDERRARRFERARFLRVLVAAVLLVSFGSGMYTVGRRSSREDPWADTATSGGGGEGGPRALDDRLIHAETLLRAEQRARARVEAQAVRDDPDANPDQKERARILLEKIDK
jgi:hypothetical protein